MNLGGNFFLKYIFFKQILYMLNQIYIHYINTLFVLESFIISCWLLKGKKIGIGIGIGQFARKKSVSESATKNHDRCITRLNQEGWRTVRLHPVLGNIIWDLAFYPLPKTPSTKSPNKQPLWATRTAFHGLITGTQVFQGEGDSVMKVERERVTGPVLV